jgi:hypothetical protein
VNLDPVLADRMVAKGYMQRVVSAAPLFAQATDAPQKPMRKRKEPRTDGS